MCGDVVVAVNGVSTLPRVTATRANGHASAAAAAAAAAVQSLPTASSKNDNASGDRARVARYCVGMINAISHACKSRPATVVFWRPRQQRVQQIGSSNRMPGRLGEREGGVTFLELTDRWITCNLSDGVLALLASMMPMLHSTCLCAMSVRGGTGHRSSLLCS